MAWRLQSLGRNPLIQEKPPMAQVSTMSTASMVASARTPRSAPRHATRVVPVRRMPEEEKMGMVAYMLQGSAFIGFLLVLFVLAGFRG
jgi:hypothetical protein